MKKTAKKLAALVLALILMVSCFAVTAAAATATTVKKYGTYLSLGDSIAVGFSLPDYNRSKKLTATKGAYPSLIAEATKADEFLPYAQLAFRTEEIRMLLDNDYDGDSLTDSEMPTNSDGVNKAVLRSERKMYQTAVKKADLITLDVGFNDIWIPFIGLTHGNNELLTLMYNYYYAFAANYAKILEKIYELNPDVTVVGVGTYNPIKDWDLPPKSGMFKYGQIMTPFFEMINVYKRTFVSKYSGKFYFAAIPDVEVATNYTPSASDGGFDPHPTLEGNRYIANQILDVLPKGDRGVKASFKKLTKQSQGWGVYYSNGVLRTTYTGMANTSANSYYVKNGKLNKSFTGIVGCNGSKWYVRQGKLQSNFSGTYRTSKYNYRISKGRVISTTKR